MRQRLIRNWTVRVVVVYATLFGLSVFALLGFVYGVTISLIDRQIDATIVTEINGLSDGYRERGLDGLIELIEERVLADRTGQAIYLLTDPDYTRITGNLAAWPDEALREGRWLNFTIQPIREGDELADEPLTSGAQARAMSFLLSEGHHLLVGRDLAERERFGQVIVQASLWSLAVVALLALVGGIIMSRDTQRRLEAINQTTRQIMLGDLKRRVPLVGSDDVFDRLSVNLNDMLGQIDRLMDASREVADNIAHDLRRPLTRLKARLELILMGKAVPPDTRQAVEQAIQETDHLLGTFAAILSIAQAEAGAGRKDMVVFDLVPLVADAADLYEAVAEEKDIALTVTLPDTPAPVFGNRHLLFQAIANLADNAVKYTPAGGTVAIGLVFQDGEALVTVADSGPGIPAEARQRVLNRFVRLDEARTSPGNGLGLSLVDAVARLHQAKLVLDDNHPGLKVSLGLALARSTPAAAPEGEL